MRMPPAAAVGALFAVLVVSPGRMEAAGVARPDAALEPACGEAAGVGCWLETAGRPGCHIWNDRFVADLTVTERFYVDGRARDDPGIARQ